MTPHDEAVARFPVGSPGYRCLVDLLSTEEGRQSLAVARVNYHAAAAMRSPAAARLAVRVAARRRLTGWEAR